MLNMTQQIFFYSGMERGREGGKGTGIQNMTQSERRANTGSHEQRLLVLFFFKPKHD